MPSLILLKSPAGVAPGETIRLDGDLLVIGRDADTCQIVIPHHAVSRKHAQISQAQGIYYIEDLKSRNHTYVNNKEVAGRAALKAEDKIKICDFLFRFHDEKAAAKPIPLPDTNAEDEGEDDPGAMTTIEATKSPVSAQAFLELAPSDRLRALLEISTGMSKGSLELPPLLESIARTLFDVFKQADRCFVILLDDTGKPIPKVTKSRRPGADDTRFSKTIVRKTVESLQSYLSEDASSDASLGPAASIAEFKIRSVMCVPLASSEGRPLGALQLDTQDRVKKFRDDDLSMLTIVANLASVAIEKSKLHETLLYREKERKEIELARTVQLGFLPQTTPDLIGFEFYHHYSPAQTVGGDYFDYIQLPNNRLAIVVGDVAGKGVPAALLVAKLSSEVRFCLLTEPDPARAINLLNDQMMRGGLGDRFVTLAVVILDPAANLVTLVNAGHMNPLLYRAKDASITDAISNDLSGLPLGVMPGFEYESVTLELDEGDTITIFTDGVTDAMSPGGELFGDDAVKKFLTLDDPIAADGTRPKLSGERLVNGVRRHAKGRPQNDDIAIVCFGRLEDGVGPGTNMSRTGPTTPTEPIKIA